MVVLLNSLAHAKPEGLECKDDSGMIPLKNVLNALDDGPTWNTDFDFELSSRDSRVKKLADDHYRIQLDFAKESGDGFDAKLDELLANMKEGIEVVNNVKDPKSINNPSHEDYDSSMKFEGSFEGDTDSGKIKYKIKKKVPLLGWTGPHTIDFKYKIDKSSKVMDVYIEKSDMISWDKHVKPEVYKFFGEALDS